ncbi:hypothetical protein XPA_001124 [Xanthoria parietina]
MHLPGSYHSDYRSFTKPTRQDLGSHGPFLGTFPRNNVVVSSGLQLSECKTSRIRKHHPSSSDSKIGLVSRTRNPFSVTDLPSYHDYGPYRDDQSIRDANARNINTQGVGNTSYLGSTETECQYNIFIKQRKQ